jgi:hypothetical protein
MQHVTQPAPSILERRPDCPLRLASAIERSLAKLPGDRFPTMDAYVAELEACLAQIGEEPELDATVIRPSPVLRQGRRRHVRAGSRSWLLATLALLLLAGALGAYALLRDTDGNESPQGTPVAAVRLAGAGALDPHGDANEHPEDAASAADRDPATYWRTEIYESGLAKPGVGLVLQAGTPRTLRTLTVVTDTPGFTAEIRTAGSADGAAEPGPVIARAKPVTGTTTFTLKPSASNYWVVWITDLGSNGVVHVNEVRARGQ